MGYQSIRGTIEMQTAIALQAEGIDKIFYDNVNYEQPGANESYAIIRVSFTTATRDVIGCHGRDDIGGTVSVFINTPTGGASSKGEDAALSVLRSWCETGGIDDYEGEDAHVRYRNLDGPRTVVGAEPVAHHLHNVAAEFRGRISDTIVYTEGAADLSSIDSNSVLPQYYKPLLKQAVSRWNKLVKYNDTTYSSIQAAVPGWNGMRLDEVTVAYEHPTKPGVIASCGPKLYSSLGGVKFTTISYKLSIYTKWNTSYSDDDWVAILAHELGHAWGIGSYWAEEFEDDGAVVPVNNFLDGTAYTNAQAAYNSLTSLTRTKVPLEATGDPGTQDAHWENEARDDSGTNYPGFTDELMVGSISPGDRRVISALTMGGLVDFGWEEVSAGANEGTPTIDLFRAAPSGYQLQPADLSGIQKVTL